MHFRLLLTFLLFPSIIFAQSDAIPAANTREEELNALQADELPQFPGGPAKLSQWINANLRIPYISLRNDTSVVVNVHFTVLASGKLTDITILQPGFRSLDKAVIDMFVTMPNWRPGYLNERPVNIRFSLPLNLHLGNTIGKPYDVPAPEVNMPQFNGGGKALAYFIRKNLKYPKEAREAAISGTVTVEFTVLSNGFVARAFTSGDAIGYGLEEEAIRIVEKMPKWKPAYLDGKPVTAKHKLLIRFDLPP